MTIASGAADHHRILAAARAWCLERCALATVIETWRSAPSPIGTHMLVHEDGRFIGSVSGGCVEGDVLQHCADVLGGAPALVRRYGVEGAAWEVGLPCGGDIAVFIQPVSAQGFSPDLFAHIEVAHQHGKALHIASNLQTGESRVVDGELISEAGQFLNTYLPPRHLLIVGAVEIASALSAIAQSMGITVTIIDPRARFLTPDRFPGVTLDDRWPDEAVAAHQPDSRTAIVVLSHDTKIDDPALIAALASPAAYVAALGSKAAHDARRARLSSLGVTDTAIDRIEGPAGMKINAITASEIALSIAAGMIRVFNLGLR